MLYSERPRPIRLVPWPEGKSLGVGVFDGPLCLGLSSRAGDLGLPWAILVDGSGRPRLDAQGRPEVEGPSGVVPGALVPVADDWLFPYAKDPVPRRILFRTRRAE